VGSLDLIDMPNTAFGMRRLTVWWDAIYVAVMIVFTLVAALFVVGCDRIIGPDDLALEEQHRGSSEVEPGKVAA